MNDIGEAARRRGVRAAFYEASYALVVASLRLNERLAALIQLQELEQLERDRRAAAMRRRRAEAQGRGPSDTPPVSPDQP